MGLIVNAVLYVVALALSLGALRTARDADAARVTAARRVLLAGGGSAAAVAIGFSLTRHWLASGVAGCVTVLVVGTCLCVALTSRAPQRSDDDEEDGGGGGGPRRQPHPPAPTEPAGGPSEDDLWTRFDRARATWGADREQIGA